MRVSLIFAALLISSSSQRFHRYGPCINNKYCPPKMFCSEASKECMAESDVVLPKNDTYGEKRFVDKDEFGEQRQSFLSTLTRGCKKES
ncbi:hypothetical protein QR680_016828 [Steinernema hermaphroditum]|uniref:WAP domain-containing protein n=1 Tax=Steinernema hermaphroditum TaxID=289476 RepID=A0AA39HEE0_9BILA|nr:hypothetical protein QR680_016828 [Steinernema hermaphroditum]